MHPSKFAILGLAAATALGSVCQAQVKNPAQLAASWAFADANGKMDTFLSVTCNDQWELTSPGKAPVPARGELRIIKTGDTYVVAQNRSGLSLKGQIAGEPLKITRGDADATTMEWAGSKFTARTFQNTLGETLLELKSPGSSTKYYVQCPLLPGKTMNDPWTPPTRNYPSYYSCQVVSERIGRSNNPADIRARFSSYAASWLKAIDLLDRSDRASERAAVDKRWADATGDQLVRLTGMELDRCGGAAPGFLPARPATTAPTPSRPAGGGR